MESFMQIGFLTILGCHCGDICPTVVVMVVVAFLFHFVLIGLFLLLLSRMITKRIELFFLGYFQRILPISFNSISIVNSMYQA